MYSLQRGFVIQRSPDITKPYITKTPVQRTISFNVTTGVLYTEEPRYNKTLHNEDPGAKNHILQPSNSKMYGENPDITNPRYNEHILPVPGHFVILGFHSIGVLFHTFYYYWAEQYGSLYRGLRYTGFRYIGAPLYYKDFKINSLLNLLKS